MTPLVKRLRNPDPGAPVLARLARDVVTENMSRNDLVTAIERITGEDPADLWEMAGHEDEMMDDDARLVLHHAITLANDLGQPLGPEPEPEVRRFCFF